MLTDEEATRVVGATLVSTDEQELGEVETIVAHASDNRAAWAAVDVKNRQVLVPLDEARFDGGRLLVRYEASDITSAPEFDGDTLDAGTAETFYEHYGINDSVLRDHRGSATESSNSNQGSSRDPRGGTGANDARQGHP